MALSDISVPLPIGSALPIGAPVLLGIGRYESLSEPGAQTHYGSVVTLDLADIESASSVLREILISTDGGQTWTLGGSSFHVGGPKLDTQGLPLLQESGRFGFSQPLIAPLIKITLTVSGAPAQTAVGLSHIATAPIEAGIG